MDSPTCHATFHLKQMMFSTNCLQIIDRKGAKGVFSWMTCSGAGKLEKQWVKIGSKDDPDLVQICLFDGHIKCLIASNETEDGFGMKHVLLTEHHNIENPRSDQLWKLIKKKNAIHILNYAQSDSCLGIYTFTNDADNNLNLLFIAPCKDRMSIIQSNWWFEPIIDISNSSICTDHQIQVQNPIKSAFYHVNANDSSHCKQPTFYLKKNSIGNKCLQLKSEGNSLISNETKCNKDKKEQRWVNVGSKSKPGWMRICHAEGQMKCLIDSNGAPSLTNFNSTEEDNPAHLWKMDSKIQLENAQSELCLKSLYGGKSSTKLITTECRIPVTQDKQWFFLPIYDADLRRICADFPIAEKNLIGNPNPESLRKLFF